MFTFVRLKALQRMLLQNKNLFRFFVTVKIEHAFDIKWKKTLQSANLTSLKRCTSDRLCIFSRDFHKKICISIDRFTEMRVGTPM